MKLEFAILPIHQQVQITVREDREWGCVGRWSRKNLGTVVKGYLDLSDVCNTVTLNT